MVHTARAGDKMTEKLAKNMEQFCNQEAEKQLSSQNQADYESPAPIEAPAAAEEAYQKIISLPIFPGLTDADLNKIINSLKNVAGRSHDDIKIIGE